MPQIEVDKNFNPFRESSGSGQKNISFPFKREKTTSWEGLYAGLEDQNKIVSKEFSLEDIEFESEEVTGSLFTESDTFSSQNTFQLHNKYVLISVKSGFLVIHQQRAHERVLYEELLRNITVQEAISQQLLFPLEFSFSKKDVELLEGFREQLEFTGFAFESFEGDTITIKGIPSGVKDSDIKHILNYLLDDLNNDLPDNGYSQNDVLAKSMAKSLAAKTGIALGKEQQEHLVNSLFACKEPSFSPDNRPVFITIPLGDIDKKFY